MYLTAVVTIIGVVCLPEVTANKRLEVEDPDGYRLSRSAQYLALAPNKVFPDQVFSMYVTLFSLPYASLNVRAVLSRNGEEYASALETFNQLGTQRLQLEVPENILPGDHVLTVEGLVTSQNLFSYNASNSGISRGFTGQPIFKNTTVIEFESKYVSLFIQTDRPLYYSPSQVLFRIIGVTRDLKSVHGSMTIYVKDGNGNIIRRWLQKQLNFGIYEDRFEITYPVNTGNWSIMVEAFGHTYEQEFMVIFWWNGRFEVNMTTPLYIFDTEWGVIGSIRGEHTSQKLIDRGDAIVQLQIREPNTTQFLDGAINKTFFQMSNELQFDFSMKEIKSKWGDVSGKELFFTGWIQDWFWLETREGTSVTKVLKDGIRIKALGQKFRTFKPNIPFTVYFAVQRSDGTPYQGFFNRQLSLIRINERNVGVTEAEPEKKLMVPEDSMVSYTVYPREDDKFIKLRVWHPVTQATVEIHCYRYWSDTNRYISITTSTHEPRVNEYMVFTVRTNFFVDSLEYLVVAGGNVLLGSTLVMRSKQKTFSIAVSRAMSPRARVVVYCVIEGEVMVDSINFFVRDTRLRQAEIIINAGKDFTGNWVEAVARGTPGSFVSLNTNDWEFWKRGAPTFLTEEKVIRELLTYDKGNEGPYQHTWWLDSVKWEETVFLTAPTSGINHMTTFNASGIIAMSDMNLTVTPESHSCNRTLGLGRCLNGACFDLRLKCNGQVDCLEDGFDELDCPQDPPQPARPHALKDLFPYSRYFEDVEWAWKTTYIKPNGQVEVMLSTPENDNPYTIGAFVLHPEEGLAIAMEPFTTEVTPLFYMTSEAPSFIQRGEQIGVRLTVFNKWDQDIEVIVMMYGHEDYRFVAVEEFGQVRSYNPRLTAGDVQTMVSLKAGESKYIYFPVVPVIESGEITVTFWAYSSLRHDLEEVTMEIGYDGVENDDQIPYLIDLVNQGSLTIQDFDIPIPERFVQPELRELIYIPGSNTVTMYAWGDVASPGFYEDYLSADSTAGVPHDSAEGYMFDFAINLQTLKFLQGASALDAGVARKALEYMKSVLMRQYAYMGVDGSYKMFRRTEKPCLWLTSFILRTLHAAQMSEWNEDIYVDPAVLDKIAIWITQQQLEDGSFPETSDVYYSRDYWPITVDEDGNEHEWHLAVTAHVTATLALAERLSGKAKSVADTARIVAADYLATKIQYITDPFQMAIVAYALNVAAHRSEYEAYSRLKTMARVGEYVYWASEEISPNPTKIVNTVHFMLPRDDIPNNGNANMATSYALMLYLAHNEWEACRPIMKWLNTQHNDFLAWSSTQDTLLVLQALSEYSLRETNRDVFQMQINLESTQPNSGFKHTINLNQTNFAELHTFELDNAWGQIKAYAQGTGYAFLHMGAFHHVEKPWQVAGPDFEACSFEIVNQYCTGRNCTLFNMEICTRWLRPDIAPESGMVFMSIAIPTGFVLKRTRILEIYAAKTPGLMRARFRDGALILFFEYVKQTPTCLKFTAERWYPVANTSIGHLVNVFEYSETGLQYNTLYETYVLFNMHICLVCGSFQCPYCPFYNTASTISYTSWVLSFVWSCLTVTAIHLRYKLQWHFG